MESGRMKDSFVHYKILCGVVCSCMQVCHATVSSRPDIVRVCFLRGSFWLSDWLCLRGNNLEHLSAVWLEVSALSDQLLSVFPVTLSLFLWNIWMVLDSSHNNCSQFDDIFWLFLLIFTFTPSIFQTTFTVLLVPRPADLCIDIIFSFSLHSSLLAYLLDRLVWLIVYQIMNVCIWVFIFHSVCACLCLCL